MIMFFINLNHRIRDIRVLGKKLLESLFFGKSTHLKNVFNYQYLFFFFLNKNAYFIGKMISINKIFQFYKSYIILNTFRNYNYL